MALPTSCVELLTDPSDSLSLMVTSATPSQPCSLTPSTPAPEASSNHDLITIMIMGNSGNMFPASRTQLDSYSPRLHAMIEKLTPNDNVISVPEDDWVINEILRWTKCTGLFVESPDAVTVTHKGLRLVILVRVQGEYKITVGLATLLCYYLTEEFVREFPIAALVIGTKHNLPTPKHKALEVLNSYPLPPTSTDTIGLQLWNTLSAIERIQILKDRRRRTQNLQNKIFEFVQKRIEDWTCMGCDDAGRLAAGWTTWEKYAKDEVACVPTHANAIERCHVAQQMERSGCEGCLQKLEEVEGIEALKELKENIKVDSTCE